MAVNSNNAVFDVALQNFGQSVFEAAGRSAEEIRKEIRRELFAFMEQFYELMIVDFLPRQSYAPYSDMYIYQKIMASKDGNGFFHFYGDLFHQLRERSAVQDFGQPRVSFSGQGEGLKEGFRSEGYQVRDIATGRYANKAAAFENIVFSLTVQLFGKSQGRTGRQIFSVFPNTPGDFGETGLRTKFAVTEFGRSSLKRGGRSFPVNHPARPLLLPFLEWFSTQGLRDRLRAKMGIEV